MTTINIPTVSTERLILRAHRLEDFETTVKIWQDPIVRKHFGARPFTREDIWARFLRQFGMWDVMGYGSFAVELKENGEYIGTVGVFEVRRDMEPNMEGTPEAGWTFASHIHGNGYATEAARAALDWTDKALGNPRLFAIISPENIASVRVAQKLGFTHWRDAVYQNDSIGIWLREGR